MDAAGARALLINVAARGPYRNADGCLMCDDDKEQQLQKDGHREYCLWREVKAWVREPLNHPPLQEYPQSHGAAG
jgi:hypothetical protein